MSTFELIAEKREDMGKGASRRLRRLEDKVPAIIYGAHKEATPISFAHKDIIKALENEAFYSHILTIKIDGKETKAILKDMQRHPYKPKITHMDLQRISAKEKLTTHIPLHFLGEDVAPGVKQGGGVITHALNQVEVSCLPADLPEFIEVDVSKLDLNESIHLSELSLPKGVTLTALAHGHDTAVVLIQPPKVAEESVVEEVAAEATPAGSSAEEDNK